MKKLTIIIILLTIWVGVFSQRTINQISTKNDALKGTYHPSDFEDFVVDWADDLVPGLSICILRNGELYWVFHHGYANLEQEKLVNDSSVFYLASVSKTICQTASMQLWEQDSLELHDYVGDYVEFPVINPYCPDSAITFFHLMTHTSSIKDNYWGEPPFNQFMPGYFTPEGSYYSDLNFLYGCSGTQWYYSNVGNSLLGYLTQKISGQDYSDYCDEHIFLPLGITEGSYYLANINPDHLVTQYTSSGPGSFTIWGTPDGGGPIYPAAVLKMSAIELSKFLGMYMKGGSYNGNTILDPETIDLITTPTGIMTNMDEQCLTWRHFLSTDNTYHSGGTSGASTLMGYDKDDQTGNILLMNVGTTQNDAFAVYLRLAYFTNLYDAISIASISVNDMDGDQVIEANETFELGLTLRNDMNYPSNTAENIMATISVNSPYLSLISDSVVALGTLNYLEEIQLPSDQFEFEISENLESGNVEFQIQFTWDDGVGYTTSFNLFVGHADILLVRDEDDISVCVETGVKKIQDVYLEGLNQLGYSTHYWDLEDRGNPTPEFIENFPAVIWFTGADEDNTLSEYNQSLLEGYLDNGGQLFLSGQNISDELAGSDFLENYLSTEHIQDTWYGDEAIKGIADDPIGNGQTYYLNQGDGIANQESMSVLEPLGNAFKSFGFNPSLEGAATRFETDTYKTVFFAFGFEAIGGFENRIEILGRILNNFFVMPHPCLPEGITFSNQEEIDSFETNYPGCYEIEGDVTISGPEITSLTGINMVSSIGGNLIIENNEILDGLTGLINLTSIGGNLTIYNNATLSSLSGLDSLDHNSISNLTIANNDSLSECNVWSVCQYLIAPGGTTLISFNKTGCNSIEEVEDACWSSIDETHPGDQFTIFPNPNSGYANLRFKTSEIGYVILDLYEISGIKVFSLLNEEKMPGTYEMKIDLSDLPKGMYFCVLKTDDGIKTKKIIKL